MPSTSALLLIALSGSCALQLQPRLPSPQRAVLRGTLSPKMQFGGGDTEQKGLSRDDEPEEFFATNMGARETASG